MLINLTNHPSTQWEHEQLYVAREKYGRVKDLPFPYVDPSWDEEIILRLASETYNKILDMFKVFGTEKENDAVHIQGEFTLVFVLVSRCLKNGLPCVASTTRREVISVGKDEKKSRFSFVRFREYRP